MLGLSVSVAAADASFIIDASGAQRAVRSDHLLVGGENPAGESIDSNDYYLTWNDQPFVPVTAEFHFARYPNAYWEESLLKIKAGGINIVATYVHWIMHEEIEGVFDWSGDRDLRRFVELAGAMGMKVIVRIGPYGHGEVRNGGFPDWLLAKPVVERSNDVNYLHYVQLFFNQTGKQLEGLFFGEGGPIIGVQLENEYQHSASAWAPFYPGQPTEYTASPSDRGTTHIGVSVSQLENPNAITGIEHMRTLKRLANAAGMEAPLYTATGWGNATIIPNETLPVAAAYVYPTWEKAGEQSAFFRYTDLQENPDYSPVSYVSADYPYFAAELGTGIPVNYTRRPFVLPGSNDAMVNRFLGSGANGIGYYMYHGGTTPKGKATDFLSEEALSYPKLSYDFQAPLGEFGEARESYHRLRALHHFVQAFGARLAPMAVVLPHALPATGQSDNEHLHFAARANGTSAFLFVNNFQDHAAVTDARGVAFQVKLDSGQVRIPHHGTIDVLAGENLILPVNMDLSGIALLSATAQPLTRLTGDDVDRYIFIAAESAPAEFVFDHGEMLKVTAPSQCEERIGSGKLLVECGSIERATFILESDSGARAEVVLLSRDVSRDAWVLELGGKNHLVISKAMPLTLGNGRIQFVHKSSEEQVTILPAVSKVPVLIGPGAVDVISDANATESVFRIKQRRFAPDFSAEMVTPVKLGVTIAGDLPPGVADLFLEIDYIADTVMAFMGNELVADSFYYGEPWRIGLKRFFGDEGWRSPLFHFRPMYPNAPCLDDLSGSAIPEFENDEPVILVNSVRLQPEYSTSLQLKQ